MEKRNVEFEEICDERIYLPDYDVHTHHDFLMELISNWGYHVNKPCINFSDFCCSVIDMTEEYINLKTNTRHNQLFIEKMTGMMYNGVKIITPCSFAFEWCKLFGVQIKAFEEFVTLLNNVTTEYLNLKAKSLSSASYSLTSNLGTNGANSIAQPQTYVAPQPMFVNVNAVLLENEQLKAKCKSQALEIGDLKARLASLGEQV